MKKILVLLLCFNIVLAPTYAFANTPLGGWTITQQIAQGASTILTGSKEVILNGAKKIATGTAKITPTASQVSKVLARGAAGYALSVAVEQLLGAVDWVLDPANNQIRYTELNPNGTEQPLPAIQYKSQDNVLYQTMTALCSDYIPRSPFNYHYIFAGGARTVNINAQPVPPAVGLRVQCDLKHRSNGSLTDTVGGSAVARTEAIPEEENEQKTLPLDVVAAQVISNAESGDAGAQVATSAAAADIIEEAETDNVKARPIVQQLENTQSIPTDQTAKGDAVPKENANTENPTSSVAAPETDLTLDFPIFCDWAPSVCQAAKEVIALPITLTDWWNTATQAISASWLTFKEWLDWTKNDSELPNTETNQVTELPIPELQENAISWSSSCPPDVQVPINLYGQSSTLTFSWSPWCQLLNVIKPAIIASAYIGAAFIVLGLRT